MYKIISILPIPLFFFFQLSTLLQISPPQAATGDAPTPSSSPVSNSLGDRVSESDPGYPIVFPLGPSFGSLSSKHDSGLAGITIPTQSVMGISNSQATLTALSMFDFNLFRWNVIQAIDILDQKIRDMLDVTEPTCPA